MAGGAPAQVEGVLPPVYSPAVFSYTLGFILQIGRRRFMNNLGTGTHSE